MRGGAIQLNRTTSIEVAASAPLEVSVAEDRVIYVTQDGAGLKDGSSWANAVDLATALRLATGLRDEVKLLAGTVTVERALSLQDFSGLILRGGYTGAGDAREGRTTFLRPANATSEYRVIEAAQDLGCTPIQSFFKVELPILMPGIIAGGLLAFTLSIDDVVITSFVNGAGTNTFPTYVSSMTKHSRNLPSVFALSTLMLLFTCALVGISKLITSNSLPKAKAR